LLFESLIIGVKPPHGRYRSAMQMYMAAGSQAACHPISLHRPQVLHTCWISHTASSRCVKQSHLSRGLPCPSS
jgi:hypothetical protein